MKMKYDQIFIAIKQFPQKQNSFDSIVTQLSDLTAKSIYMWYLIIIKSLNTFRYIVQLYS